VRLIVNVASECGYTPQYQGLEALYRKFQSKGLVILAFPCNQFGEQEPGTAAEIKSFCSSKFGVTFPLFEKIEVNGPHRHPLYVALAGKGSPFPGDITWNFNKFLIGRDGKILRRFDSDVEPESTELTGAIEKAIQASQGSTAAGSLSLELK
jgi:glutathione peroxidase